ncbi:fungal zn(2)-Cys(6) binuclear cluster domain-containing protein [Rhizoctonia solani AG-1 IA]|uniref:Fungal specific transcription factor domain n=2 Tax=Rhizoctonia solani TaxID=456999 RepID=A0A8H3AV44_9AGAM
MVVTHESAPPKAKPKGQGSSSNVPGKEKRLRSKEGCLTCRIRGKKCDQGKLTEDDAQHPGCAACRRLRIECLGYARNRPEWLKGPQVDEFKRTIKMFLAENSPRVQRTPRTSDSGSLPFLTFDNLRNGAATSFVPVGPSSSSVNGAAEASSPAQPPEGQDGTRGDFNPPPIPPTYAHAQYQVPMAFGPPPQHQQLPGHPIQSHGIPHQLPPIAHPHDPNQLQSQAGIPLDPALAIDPALEDANMQTLAPVLAQLGVIGRLRPAAPEQQDHTHVAVGYTVSHDRGTPPAAPAPAAPVGENALHNIGVRVLEVLIAGGKPVEAAAVRAWAGVVGASVAWGEVVVEIVGATRAEPGTVISFTGPIPENLDQLGANALQACALMCLGLPGAEEVLAKRLEERRWGEEVAEGGIAENWQRAGEVLSTLAGAGVAGAAEAVARLEARQGKPAEVQDGLSGVKPEEAGGDVHMDSDDKSTVVAPAVAAATLNTPVVQNDPAVTSITTV